MGKMDETHTPGPWRVRGTNFGYTNCDVLGPPHPDGGDYAPICRANSEANARLIAAAPELLEACKELVQSLEVEKKRSGIVCFGFEAAKAAILKVEEGVKSEKRKAFFVSEIRTNDHGEYIALIAVEGESGFYVTDWCWGKDFKVAQDIADERNARLGLSKKEAAVIVCSTMRSVKMPEADDEVSHE
jgi:hypothetical protein